MSDASRFLPYSRWPEALAKQYRAKGHWRGEPLTAMLAREAQVEQSDVRGANVRVASRGWRNTGTNSGHGNSQCGRSNNRSILTGRILKAPAKAPPRPADD